MQLHWHENPLYRFAARADLAADPTIRRNVGRLADYGWSFDLQVFARQMADAAGLAEACPNVTFVLQHAGMLEDLCHEGRAEWHAGMVRLAACPNVVAKLSGLGTFFHRNDPAHIADIMRETVRIFGAERCLFGSNFPIEKLWTSYGELVDAYRDAVAFAFAREQATRSCTTPPCGFIALPHSGGEPASTNGRKTCRWRSRFSIMAISSWNSSFLVLGRDCGRTRRVLTLGFLILGGDLSDPRRHRLSLQPDHGNAGHARAAIP